MSLNLEQMIIALPLAVCVRFCDLVLLLNDLSTHCVDMLCLQDSDSVHSYELNCIAQMHADMNYQSTVKGNCK